jgi:hypothetical protein
MDYQWHDRGDPEEIADELDGLAQYMAIHRGHYDDATLLKDGAACIRSLAEKVAQFEALVRNL